MIVCVLWDWEPEYSQATTWKDGLAAAIKELSNRGHNVHVITTGADTTIKHPYFDIHVTSDVVKLVKQLKPNVILHWADMTRRHARPLYELGIPQAICFAGGEPLGENYPFFAHVFVESQVYKDIYDEAGVSCSVAFGTNTELFKPVDNPKAFDTILPGTFAAWKRHNIYAQATKGLRSVACGYMYDDHEQDCWQDCVKAGVTILPHVSADVLHYLYAASKVCVVTSSSAGGSQRTVLEAMSMNLPLIVTDSDKYDYAKDKAYVCDPNPTEIRSYINAILDGDGDVNTRDYILENWSEYTYADSLEAGLLNLL